MGEDSYLDSYYEDRFEVFGDPEPDGGADERLDPDEYDPDEPWGPVDLTDDGDALASAGFGTDEDYYGGYEE